MTDILKIKEVLNNMNFDENGSTLQELQCHEICLVFVMKPRGTQELHSNSCTNDVKEEMYWIPITDLGKHKAFPSFLKEYLSREHDGIEHIVTDERI